MKIGFYINWKKNSLSSSGNVLGDELFGESMCRSLTKIQGVHSAKLYASNYLPQEKLDYMIYLNDTQPNENWAYKHVLYMQNAYGEGSETAIKKFQKIGYDRYAFISKKILDIHVSDGFTGIFLPFGVDTGFFYPRPFDRRFDYEVSYIGNDIKGLDRTSRYLLPAADFHFGLYGNWRIRKAKKSFWKILFGGSLSRRQPEIPEYKKLFSRLSKGKIPQEEVPVLYSSSKINLNCTAQDCVDWDVITLRTFEVLACKGFLITDKTAIAETILKDGAVFTEGGEDLSDKIRYYIDHEKERDEIAGAGYEYVVKNASIDSRMRELFEYLQGIGV